MIKNVTVYLTIILIISVIGSCKTKSLSVRVLKPAEIYVPGEINTLAIVNRSLPEKGDGSRVINVLEGLVTGEGLFVDRFASDKCIGGLAEGLRDSPRFKVTVPTGLDIRGTGTAQFPEPMQWDKVEEICLNYSAEALVLLETFDSNLSRRFNVQQKTRTENGKEINYNEHMASIDIAVNAGWRIYFPMDRKIIDQSTFTDTKSWNEKGMTKIEAEGKLPKIDRAVEDAGYFAGRQYALRISPTWVWVPRKYYIKGNDDFKRAKYKVQADQWEDAADIWKIYISDPDPKIAGYACYNMALASEVLGKFEIALDWAKKAYSDYYLKAARDYIYILESRIEDAEKLDNQMNN
jgi:hypothetical protein